jgi:hypothetical protein
MANCTRRMRDVPSAGRYPSAGLSPRDAAPPALDAAVRRAVLPAGAVDATLSF